MSVKVAENNLVSFKYDGGSQRGYRVVRVNSVDDNYLNGNDVTCNGPRKYLHNKISDLTVLSENADSVNASVLTSEDFLSEFGVTVSKAFDPGFVLNSIVDRANSFKDENWVVLGDKVVQLKPVRSGVETTKINENNMSIKFKGENGDWEINVFPDGFVSTFHSPVSGVESAHFNTPVSTISDEVLEHMNKFLGE